MTRRRWIADQFSENRALLTGAHAEHLSRVLRAQVGQEFDVVVGNEVRRGRVASIANDRVEFELGDVVPAPTPVQITLVLAISKFDRMEWAIEKCTELGVTRIIPLVARRSEAHLVKAATKRVERWQRIARESAEQSRRGSPPEISQPMKLTDALALPGGVRIVLSESEREIMLVDALQEGFDFLLALGPEGGWTDSELAWFREARWISASLGTTVLRVETAAVAAVAVVLSQGQR